MLFKKGHGLKFSVYNYFKCQLSTSTIYLSDQACRRKYLSKLMIDLPIESSKESKNCLSHNLFLNGAMIYPTHAGVFTYLPHGLRALEKLTRLIDEEMQDIGAQKIAMPTLIRSSLWKKTERWNTKELFKIKDRHNKEYCLGPTHEEVVTDMIAAAKTISAKKLPLMLYQITKKFRDEMHPKFALLRGREFEMKDMYTFDSSEDNAISTYRLVCEAYCNIFDRLGLEFLKVEGSTGNIGGTMSHEFHLPAAIGEDTLYVCKKCGHGKNEELISKEDLEKDNVACNRCDTPMTKLSGIEVGHAFLLGRKYSEVFKATCVDRKDESILEMGCYGLGVSRILQASVEVLSKEKKIRWPSLIAPYQVCIIRQMGGYGGDEFEKESGELSDVLTKLPNLKNEVVIDDRIKLSVGVRIQHAKVQGYPHIVVVGRKCLEEPKLFEVLDTISGETEFMTLEQVIDKYRQIETI